MNDRQERTIAKTDARVEEIKTWRKETTAYQEATDACLEKTEAYLESKEPTAEVMEA
jgi:hypothetical protein